MCANYFNVGNQSVSWNRNLFSLPHGYFDRHVMCRSRRNERHTHYCSGYGRRRRKGCCYAIFAYVHWHWHISVNPDSIYKKRKNISQYMCSIPTDAKETHLWPDPLFTHAGCGIFLRRYRKMLWYSRWNIGIFSAGRIGIQILLSPGLFTYVD